MKKNKKVKQVYAVPYQKCPVCEGAGRINTFNSNYDYENLRMQTSISTDSTCTVCLGAKIIPMHVIQPIALIEQINTTK